MGNEEVDGPDTVSAAIVAKLKQNFGQVKNSKNDTSGLRLNLEQVLRNERWKATRCVSR